MAEFVNLNISRDGVGTIRIDRVPVNALNATVAAELGEAVAEVAVDGGVRAVIVWGGDKVFAAGADVKEMIDLDPISMYSYIGPFQDALTHLENLPVITIAAINGYALGGGCEIALACDLRICADDSQLGQPETTLGIIPGAGGTQRLPRLIGMGRAKELIYSGRFVPAEEAHAIGLVNEVHEGDDVLGRAEELARRYAEGPGVALRAAKEAIQRGTETDLATGLLIEKQAFASLFATGDQRAGMSSFVQKGPGRARFSGR